MKCASCGSTPPLVVTVAPRHRYICLRCLRLNRPELYRSLETYVIRASEGRIKREVKPDVGK